MTMPIRRLRTGRPDGALGIDTDEVALDEIPSLPLPEMSMPSPVLLAITFAADGVVPPMVLLGVAIKMPDPPFPYWAAAPPWPLTPMKLPSTRLPSVPEPVRSMPSPVSLATTLSSDDEVPPMVLPRLPKNVDTDSPGWGVAARPR